MYCKIQVVGNLGKDPEIRHLPSGAMAASFSVAVNKSYRNRDGETVNEVTWFNIVAYQNGESGLVSSLIQKYLRKGQLVFIDGEPTIRTWQAQDGSDRRSFEIKLGPQSTIKMLGGRPDGQRAANGHDERPRDGADGERPGSETPGEREKRQRAEMMDDDIPF